MQPIQTFTPLLNCTGAQALMRLTKNGPSIVLKQSPSIQTFTPLLNCTGAQALMRLTKNGPSIVLKQSPSML